MVVDERLTRRLRQETGDRSLVVRVDPKGRRQVFTDSHVHGKGRGFVSSNITHGGRKKSDGELANELKRRHWLAANPDKERAYRAEVAADNAALEKSNSQRTHDSVRNMAHEVAKYAGSISVNVPRDIGKRKK